MAKSSDIIKIGFDYRASLEQFVKETNGVFDGISEKAGKQRISIQLDAKNDKVIEKIKELQKLKLDSFTFEFGESGLAEQLKTFDQLEKKINEIINLSKGINNIGSGNGIGNSIVDEKSLNSIIDLFGKMENHLGEIKKVFTDVGDGGEFSPLLSTIDKINNSIKELSTSVKGIGLNMNIDVGSDTEMEAKVQSKISNALQAYQRLFDHIKMSSAGGAIINTKFFDFDINQYDTMIGKLQAYKKFIENMRNEAKAYYGGQDVLFQDTEKSYWTSASAAMGQVTKAFNEMNASADTSPLDNLFGGKTDLTEVVSQLNLIVDKLGEISTTASEFKNVFANGFNVSASVEEIEKLTGRVKELEDELSKVKVSSTSPVETNISSPIKDTFQGDAKASAEASSSAVKEEAKAMEQVAESAENASKGKNKFSESNKKVKQSADASVNAVNEEKLSLSSMQKEIDKYNKKYKDFNRKPTDANRSNNYQSALNDYKKSIEELQKFYNTLDNSTPITSEQLSKWKELTTNVDIASDALKSFSAAEKGSTEGGRWKEIDKISKYLDKNTKISKEARQQLQWYLDLLKSGSAVNIEEIHMQFNKIAEAERRAGREGKSFFDILTNKSIYGLAARFASYYLSFMDFIRYARNGINAIRELDTALVDLQKTTTMNTNQLEDFYYASNDVAKQMGVTTAEIINQASAWSRLGYSSKEAATEMAALSSQFASISPGMDLDTATDGLVSTMKAFDIEVEDVERKIMDNINRIGNTAATSNDEIVDMLTRSSAAMAVANNTLEETIALETAAVEITRSAESTGTAFKTISMRIRGYDEETEELSEDLKNISGEIADLTKTASTPGGISLFTDENKTTYKSTYQILKEISEIYDELTDKQQADLLEKLAGKRGGQVVGSLLLNFESAEKALKEMEQAAGSADAEMSIIEESIDYKLNALKETWVGNAQEMLDRGDFGAIIDGLTKLSEAIGWVIDKAGLLGTVGLIGGGILGVKNAGICV